MFESSKMACEIHFTDNKSVFYTNEKVSGIVTLNLNEKVKKFTHINIEFFGNAKVKFFVPSEDKRRSIVHKGEQVFIHEKKNLLRSENDGMLPICPHNFGFKFYIPFEMPTSLDGDHHELYNDDNEMGLINFKTFGFIRYMLIVKLENNDSVEHSFEFPITVIKKYDLNFAKEALRNPVKYHDFKKFKFSSKTLYMLVQIPAGAFVCGQKVKFSIRVENDSSNEVKSIEIELIKCFAYTSDKPRKDHSIARKSLTSIAVEGIPGKTTKDVEALFTIPCVSPSSEGLCKILELSYEFQVTAKFKGLHSNLVLKLPIVIGTVPFVCEDSNRLPLYDTVVSEGASTSTAQPPMPATPETYDIAPPTYMEAIGQIGLNEEDSGEHRFHPTYPMFKFFEEQS